METSVKYQTSSKPEDFFEAKSGVLFHEFLEIYHDRIESIKYTPFGPEEGLNLEINCFGPDARTVFLKNDTITDGQYIIALTKLDYPAEFRCAHLLLTLMGWEGRPIYTPAFRDDMTPVLGCSRRRTLLTDIQEFYDMTIGLAEAMDKIDSVIKSQRVFSYLWKNY